MLGPAMSNADTAKTHTLHKPSARSDSPPTLTFSVLDGPDRGMTATSSTRRAVLGRGEDCDVRLADPAVSAFHAEFVARDGSIDVRDLGSRNGTLVGGIVVRDGSLTPGTTVQLGSTSVCVTLGDPAAVVASKSLAFGELVGVSTAMREAFAALERISRTDLSVLLQGETGTGKDLAARALHSASARHAGPFVTLDCSSIPPGLAESTLFGHTKGSFTGATERREGVFATAASGTLFLDEVGELPLDLQPKLLRALERREIVPVGGAKTIAIDVRFVSASWRDLRALVNRGAFREDLYHRLAQVRVRLPSLADRPDDVKPLVQHFLSRIPWSTTAARSIDPAALEMLATRSYPGNVRELKYTVERAAMLADGAVITADDLAFERRLDVERQRASAAGSSDADRASVAPESADASLEPFKDAKRTIVDDFERRYLARLLERAGTNISKAARLAGLERQSLRELLRRHGLRGQDE